MSQATASLPQPCSSIEALFTNHQAALAEKRRVYALAEQAGDADADAAEAACDAACDAEESVADMILARHARSQIEFAIQARVLLARGADPADLFYYRPEDLTRFIQEIAARL